MIWNIIFSCNLALASNADHDYYVQYSGSTDASWGYHPNCTFTVEKIVDNRFIGEFAALNLGTYSFSEKISGKVYTSNDSFTCSFTVKFYNNRYYSNVVATVYPYEGKCECFCAGSWHLEDFTMTGTKISKTYNIKPSDFEDDKLNYSQEDFNICLNSSANIYDKEFNNNSEIPDLLYNSLLENNFYVDPESTESSLENFQDSDPDNISYTISYRENDYMTRSSSKEKIADMIVILRGTNADEWSGNTEITGTAYDSEQLTHKNFKQAKDSLKPYIDNEYKYLKHQKNYDKINLIITGHSRGAAVANLYAKDATDYNDTPYFNSVIAYTFAAPNVEKYNSDMESYDNIYNFCIKEDLVPTVPLTNPAQGWNYWKYGHTYNLDSNTYGVSNAGIISVHAAFTQWNSIKKYYEKPLIATNGKVTTLYNTLHDILGIVKTNDDLCRIINSKKVINKLGSYYQLTPLIESAIINAYSIGKAHSYNLYSDKMQGLSLNDFDEYSYNDSLNDLRYVTNLNNKILKDVIDDPIILSFDDINYDEAEVLKLISFANTNSNNNILKWDLDSPNTWNEIVWDDNGKIKEIDFSYLNLSGTLDCSNLSSLKNVNVYGNNISQIVLTNCTSLENLNIADNNINNIDLSDCINLKSLNCSFNNLSSLSRSIIDSNNAQLEYLYCDGCGLSYLDISSQSELKEISCSFNSLKNIELLENSKITSVTCCYNYLDTHEGSTLYNKLNDLMFSDCYVNYYPQSVPDTAIFDTNELNALKTFANTNENNTALDWLDDSGNIDIEKLQNNILFEYDGSKYRVVAIDISDLDISGALDLTSLSLLQELYCENTKITTLNIKGCTKLENLKCDGCELTSITLPSNANAKTSSLYDVSCEYNYLDTSIFTQDIIKYVEFKAGGEIHYKNQKGDSSALQAALYFANKLDEKDYSEETFTPFKELIDECNAYNYDNLYLTQEDIDEITTNILVSMYELKAYFKVNISSSNGSFTVNDEKSGSSYKQSLLYGTTVTLNAVPNEGYIFVGWYDTVNNIYMSKNQEYTFKVSTNTDLKAVFIAKGSATLTFVNHSNWVAGTFTKSTAEWAEVTSINDSLPEVPFRFGYSNGRWVYDEQEVLSKLRAGEDVVIGAEYDEDDASFPTPPVAKDKPVLELYYKYNEENTLGTFMMAAGFPENIKVESVGIAFYYKKADLFDPRDNFTLLLNNKMMIGRFNTEQLEDIYIINMHKMTSTYNWAARGFVTYYDSNGNLVTEYSNQINIIDRQNADEIK